jgi:endonuclease/exonuclease/phosphatase family metal-dependent hydrolase
MMQLRVITWNLWRKKPERVWEIFPRTDIPTVFLLQEVPCKLSNNSHLLSRDISRNKRATAILSELLPLREIKLGNHSDTSGTVVVANLDPPDGSPPITLISIYGLMVDGHAITGLHRLFSDLTPILAPTRKRVIVGGDSNASLQCDRPPKYQANRIFFERVKDFGLIDCFGQFPVRTWRNPKNTPTPWQLDYLFASANLARKLVSCEVPADDNLFKFSDHKPVVAVFDL